MTPSVSFVVVNFNAGSHLRACLDSLRETMEGLRWDGVVIDNASSDGSEAAAQAFGPAVRLVRNRENVGFGRAVNQGVAATAGDLVLVINPDCRARPGLVQALAAALQASPRAALAGPRVLDPDGAVQGSARGDPTLLTGLFGRTSLLARLFPGVAPARANNRTEDAIRSGQAVVPVDWVSGACMLARREALEAVGGFDERYFLYWEDADLCRRLRARGREVCYVPGATVVHEVGRSSRHVRARAVREFHRSAYRYYATHVASSAAQRAAAGAVLSVRCGIQLILAARRVPTGAAQRRRNRDS